MPLFTCSNRDLYHTALAFALTLPVPARAVVLNDGDLVVANSLEASIIHINPLTGSQTLIFETDTPPASIGDRPGGIAIDADGMILSTVASIFGDRSSARVVRIDPKTGMSETLSSLDLLNDPKDVEIDSSGRIFVAQPGQILEIDPTTGLQTVISQFGELSDPFDIEIDSAGDLIVTDNGSVSLLRIDPATGIQQVIAGRDEFFSVFMTSPQASAIEGTGNIITSGILSIARIDPLLGSATSIAMSPSGIVSAIVVDGTGDLLFGETNSSTIRRLNVGTGRFTVVSAGGIIGSPIDMEIFRTSAGPLPTAPTTPTAPIPTPTPGTAPCEGDFNGDGDVTVDEILTALNRALNGCSSTPY